MLRLTNLLQIDDQPMPEPTDIADIQFKDVESSDSGTDEMGVYHREVLRFGVVTCTLTYDYLDNSDCAYLLKLLRGKTTFRFTFPVATDTTEVTRTMTRICYCANYGAALQRLSSGGLWRGMKLTIQEC